MSYEYSHHRRKVLSKVCFHVRCVVKVVKSGESGENNVWLALTLSHSLLVTHSLTSLPVAVQHPATSINHSQSASHSHLSIKHGETRSPVHKVIRGLNVALTPTEVKVLHGMVQPE